MIKTINEKLEAQLSKLFLKRDTLTRDIAYSTKKALSTV